MHTRNVQETLDKASLIILSRTNNLYSQEYDTGCTHKTHFLLDILTWACLESKN